MVIHLNKKQAIIYMLFLLLFSCTGGDTNRVNIEQGNDNDDNDIKVDLRKDNSTGKSVGIEGNNNDDNTVVIGNNNVLNTIKESTYEAVKFKVEEKDYSHDGPGYADAHASIKFICPISGDTKVDIPSLQSAISKDVFGSHHIDGNIKATIDKSGNDFIESYSGGNPEYATSRAWLEWELKEVFNDDYVLVLKREGNIYTGGAHSLPVDRYYNYDLLTGKSITYEDVFHYRADNGLEKIIEKKIKEFSGGNQKQSLDELGFFEEDFEVSKEIYITNTDVCFVYPPYKITSFAYGDINVCIDLNELRMFYKPTFPLKRLLK